MKITERLVRKASIAISMVMTMLVMAGYGPVQAQGEGPDSYSVVILDNQSRDDAERGRQLLEGWGYAPITITPTGDRFSVLYGAFDSATAARQVMDQLRNEGISAKGVMPTPSRAPETTPMAIGAYAVVVQEFKTSNNAMLLQQTLSQAGFTPVSVRQAGTYFRVLITDLSHEEAILTLGQLRQQGYMTARVLRMESVMAPPPAVPAAPTVEAVPGTPSAQDDYGISAAVMQTDLWNELSEDQKREVIKSMAIQEQLRKGDALAQEVIDINKRLSGLDENVRKIISQIEEEKTTAERVRGEIGELFKESDNLMRAEEYQEAIVRLNKVLALDKDNQYGQAAFARRLIERAESRLRDESYEGQSADIENRYQALKADAERLSANKNSASDLQTALGLWIQIKNLDAQKYGTTANSRISELTEDLKNLSNMNDLALAQSRKMMLYVAIGLGAGFIILFALLIIVWLRGRARHNQLMMKVQEITSIRPMRELQGGPTGMLEGSGGADATDFDIFAPQTPKPKAKQKPETNVKKDEDSLGGLADTKNLEPDISVSKNASMEEDAFGTMGMSDEAPTVNAVSDDMNFDDIFGGNGSEKSEGSALDVSPKAVEGTTGDPFAQIAGQQSEPDLSAQPTVQTDITYGEAMEETKPANEPASGEMISFDDIVSASGRTADAEALETPTEAPPEDLLALFDDVVGPSPDETSPAAEAPSLEHLEGGPFNPSSGEDETKPAANEIVKDETEIPLINLEGDSQPDVTIRNETTRASEDLLSFSLDDISTLDNEPATQESTPMPELTGGAVVAIDFSKDSVGQKPEGWEGEYDYASLIVEDSNPPAGGGKYICFRKPEGGGKAFYACHFPEITGKCAIEFDLCCQEKNKFLLGFYIEKDEQFQTSIHTKILRSETQTTPTIHMQGESASYLLGSWTHIRYIVDLNEGLINGYIDSTHVAHDLPLVQNPGALNTFSIRDNINTTGVLMLANLRVYRVQ